MVTDGNYYLPTRFITQPQPYIEKLTTALHDNFTVSLQLNWYYVGPGAVHKKLTHPMKTS